ncbi:hypothetical protein AGR8A_pTi20040 [Agrobacterium fabrum str. J-07]|nr:hypothetical protein AGR8A_pTi20040 [Agrobacterium fabrum str. J-07]
MFSDGFGQKGCDGFQRKRITALRLNLLNFVVSIQIDFNPAAVRQSAFHNPPILMMRLWMDLQFSQMQRSNACRHILRGLRKGYDTQQHWNCYEISPQGAAAFAHLSKG